MKRRYYRILSFVLSACILLSTLSVSAFALSWDGSSTGGGGGGENATVNGFAIRKTEDNCIGYRFSVVDNNGNTKNGKVIDVFTKKGYGYYEMEHGYKFDTKYNKKQLIAYQDGSFSTSLTQVNCYKEEEMNFVSTLPDPEDVETWQNYSGNLNPVLAKLSAGTVDTLSYGDKVLIEPIYDVKLEKVYHAITVTELAIYGKHLLGADSDGGTPNHDAGTWGFISSYTNRHYPNSLYTPDGQGLWTGAEPIANRTRATFYTMINVGYGVGIAFTQTKNTNYTIRFNANGGTGSMADMSMSYGTAKNLTANSYTKTGHYFSGWNTKANGSGTSYTNCQSVSNLTTVNGGVVTLYAQWTPYYLDVYYHANGGSVSSSTYYLRSNWVAVTSTQAFKNDRWVYNLTYSGGLYDASAYSGTAVGDGSYLGYTTGSTFSLYRYLNGYPMLGDELWYTISFSAETVNTYVRQTVWIQNGETVSRDVYSNSNTTFSVKLDPYTVTSEDQYFYVRARMDWIDANGNVLKFGTAKVFYIPVRPTVHRPEVTLKDYTGSIAAVGKETSSTGKVYLGQLVSANYKYTTDNEWVSKNMLTGTMQEWKNGTWTAVDGSPDYEAMQSMIYPTEYISGSTLGKVRVMDNSGSGKSIMRFELTSAWSSDQSRTLENTVISIPVVKADVELKEIRLVNASGYYADASHLTPGEVLTVQYLYKNNTDVAIYVEGYDSNRNKIDGVYRIEPNGSIIVEGATVTAPTSGKFTVWGGVYLEGAGLGNTVWESNGSNNEKEIECFTQYPLKLVPIEPNAPYRESTEVITSYWLVNNGSIGCKPSDNILVRFKVYKPNGTLITTVTKTQVVCPGNDKNLVYFKWAVPTGLNGNDVTVTAEIIGSGTSFFSVSSRYGTRKYDLYQTPDTQYEETMPSGFTAPSAPSSKSDRATWYEYSYNGTSFVKTNYGIAINGNPCAIEPATGSTAEYSGGKWIMKSGYGISVKLSTAMTSGISGYASAKTDSYTQPQYFTALYPEYKYIFGSDKCTTLTVSGSYAELPVFKTYGKVHFTPLWYPDGNYTVSILASDCWTPAGMLTVKSVSNTITISGNAYDDWYIGRN